MTHVVLVSVYLLGLSGEIDYETSNEKAHSKILEELKEVKQGQTETLIQIVAANESLRELSRKISDTNLSLHGTPGKEGQTGLFSRVQAIESSQIRHSRLLWGVASAFSGVVVAGAGTGIGIIIRRLVGNNGKKK